jgi:hypothetical protein
MKLSYDSEGNYHDDDIRIEAYSESADFNQDVLVEEVVNQIEREIGDQLRTQPHKSVREIKIMAMNRFLDLIEKKLLSVKEAERCYQRFSQQVDYYYGS